MADFYTTINSTLFQQQVKFYANKAAIAVSNEATTTPYHIERIRFAKRILSGGTPVIDMAMSCGANATIRSKIEADQDYESDLEFVINSIYDSYAVALS